MHGGTVKNLSYYLVSRQQLIFRLIGESLNVERLLVLLHVVFAHHFTAHVTVRPMYIFRCKCVINTVSTDSYVADNETLSLCNTL